MALEPDDATPTEPSADAAPAAVRHGLRAPLTAISGQTQLARRRVRRMADGPDRDYVLARLAAVEAAVLAMGERIERLGRDPFPNANGRRRP